MTLDTIDTYTLSKDPEVAATATATALAAGGLIIGGCPEWWRLEGRLYALTGHGCRIPGTLEATRAMLNGEEDPRPRRGKDSPPVLSEAEGGMQRRAMRALVE